MRYPIEPGYKEDTTSKDAADDMQGRASLLRVRCCHLLMYGEYTADELANMMGETVLSVRPRISELKRLGLVQNTGVRRRNISGKNAIVWALK